MACVTLKRNVEFDPMYSSHGRPCKRAKVNSGPGRQSISPQPDQPHPQSLTPNKISPQPKSSSPFVRVPMKLTPEKMAANIKEEAHRLTRKKQLRFSDQRTSTVTDYPSSSMRIGNFHARDDEKPMFTISQVAYFCQRMMDEQRQRIREEYEKALKDKLAEQYDTFVRFDHDQLQKKLVSQNCPSYLS